MVKFHIHHHLIRSCTQTLTILVCCDKRPAKAFLFQHHEPQCSYVVKTWLVTSAQSADSGGSSFNLLLISLLVLWLCFMEQVLAHRWALAAASLFQLWWEKCQHNLFKPFSLPPPPPPLRHRGLRAMSHLQTAAGTGREELPFATCCWRRASLLFSGRCACLRSHFARRKRAGRSLTEEKLNKKNI